MTAVLGDRKEVGVPAQSREMLDKYLLMLCEFPRECGKSPRARDIPEKADFRGR